MAMMNEMEYRTIGSALAGGYRAAVYCRLSKDDDQMCIRDRDIDAGYRDYNDCICSDYNLFVL